MNSFGTEEGNLARPHFSSENEGPQQMQEDLLFQVDRQRANLAKLILMVGFYSVLANIPYWITSSAFGFVRKGIFNLDYVLVGLIALYLPRILSAVLLFLAILIDVSNALSKTFLLPLKECVEGFGAVRQFPASRQFEMIAVLVLALLVSAVAAFVPSAAIRKHYRIRAGGNLLAFAVVLIVADAVASFYFSGHVPGLFQPGTGAPTPVVKQGEHADFRIIRNPTKQLIYQERLAGEMHSDWGNSQRAPLASPSAAEQAISSAGIASGAFSAQMPNLVLILVESWGLDVDSSVRQALIQPYSQAGIQTKYKVVQGTVPFFGGTVVGEGRELCGNRIGFRLLTASREELQNCLPGQLDSKGYHSVALHGGNKLTFLRQFWYPAIGFEEMFFYPQFKGQGLPDCDGAFVGTCDGSIAGWISGRLATRSASPSFIYWVTLNSHLPVPDPMNDGASCSFSPALAALPAYCSWYQIVAKVHQSVSALATSNLARPTVFAIVGDHMPPFGDADERGQFSKDVVPFILLVPRNKTDQGM